MSQNYSDLSPKKYEHICEKYKMHKEISQRQQPWQELWLIKQFDRL